VVQKPDRNLMEDNRLGTKENIVSLFSIFPRDREMFDAAEGTKSI
jgi:hypothetical protein